MFTLEIEQFHHQFIGVTGIDLTLEKNDTVFQQQVAQCQLSLTLVALVGMRIAERFRKATNHIQGILGSGVWFG
jgi:hypothetical protein